MMESYPQTTLLSDDRNPESLDERYMLLSDERRRVVLDILTDQSEPIELTALSGLVAAAEHDGDVDEVCPSTRERIAVSLHHIHLPKMDDFGVVEYDTDTQAVEPCMSRIYDLLA